MHVDATSSVRPARFSGTWYPGDARALSDLIARAKSDALDREAHLPSISETARFAILPHAGLTFSARGIAHFFLHLPVTVERLLIIAPSHYLLLPPDILTTHPFDSYETPLGSLSGFPLEGPVRYIRRDGEFALLNEHAVEMPLPWVDSSIAVSMALISQISDGAHAFAFAHYLLEALGKDEVRTGKVAVIASSDFTHYGKRFSHEPFAGKDVKRLVEKEDGELAALLASGRPEAALDYGRKHRSTVCGLAPASILSAMGALCGTSGMICDYYTSNDVFSQQIDEFVAYCTVLWR